MCIYHLLSAAFGQGIAVAQVVDLDVFNVVTILLVDLNVEGTTIGGSGGRLCRARGDTGRVCLGRSGQRVVPLTSLHSLGEVRAILHESAGHRHAAAPSSGSGGR